MVRFVLRSLWRLLILMLGISLAYFSVFVAFPFLNRRLPIFFALLLVYIGVAYFGLPALIRTLRLFIRPNHIPLYATTRDGLPSDPVNIAVAARSKRQFVKAMQAAGWYTADKVTLRNGLREIYAVIFDKPYPTAPFSNLYLFNRPFDIGFQIPYGYNKSPRHRHHVRFWQLVDHEKDHGHFSFWVRHFRRFVRREKSIWIGTAIDDSSPYGIRWYNLQVTHRTHHLHYRERDFVIDSLKTAGQVKDLTKIKAGKPFEMHSQQVGSRLICDGTIQVIELK